MASETKHHYLIELDALSGADPWLDFEVELRAPTPDDIAELGALMVDAYRGTVDYQGETIEEAREEIDDFFEESADLEASYVALVDDKPVGAILTSTWEGDPLVSYVMTRPEYKNQGLATMLLRTSLRALRERGAQRVHAFITEGNIASEALFRGAGAILTEDGA